MASRYVGRVARATLQVGTWNCFGMGQTALHALTHFGAPSSARLLHADVIAACVAPDVLCVQELFSREAQRFFDGLAGRFDALVRDHNRVSLRTITMRGHGLGIASRRRVLSRSHHHFRARSSGWDRLARKGALHALVLLDDGVLVDVLTCHLQAGYDVEAQATRAAQLVEVRAIVDALGARERPFIVCGDFNIDGLAAARAHAEYRRLTSALEGFRDLGASDDLPTLDPHPERNPLAHMFNEGAPPQRLDYFFFRAARDAANAAPHLACTAVERILDRPLSTSPSSLLSHGPREHASDHYGLRATFDIVGA